MKGVAQRVCTFALIAVMLSACAAPPLKLYTLTPVPESSDPSPLPRNATIIVVDRVYLPDYLDTQDLIIRRGNVLDRSQTGRWASRLSMSATDLLTAKLAMRRPDALVTDGVRTAVPDYEITVDVSRLDVSSAGQGVMDADWQIIPRADTKHIVRDRVRVTLEGSVASDKGIVGLESRLFERLAASIDISGLR